MSFQIHQSLQFLSVVISPATCLLFVSYMSILSDCYQSFINIKQTPLIPIVVGCIERNWFACRLARYFSTTSLLAEIICPQWDSCTQKWPASKEFSVAANFTHMLPSSHIPIYSPPWKCQWTHRSKERPQVSKKNIDRTGAWRQVCPSCPYHLDQALSAVFLWGETMEDTINILCPKLCKCGMCICICSCASYMIYTLICGYYHNCTIANKPGTGNPTRKIVCNASEHNLIHKHCNGPKCKYT